MTTIYNILDILYKKRICLLHFIEVLNDMYSSENACYLKMNIVITRYRYTPMVSCSSRPILTLTLPNEVEKIY
jgi:hypothetical protein